MSTGWAASSSTTGRDFKRSSGTGPPGGLGCARVLLEEGGALSAYAQPGPTPLRTRWLQLVMPPFGKLTAEQQKLEGELRHHHSRLLAHAEEIAFSNGGAREKELAEAALQRISRRANTVHLLRSFVGMLDSYTVKYGGSMAAFTVMMPAVYFGKRKSTKGKGIVELTGYYLVATALFKALGDAVKALYMSSYKGITEVAGLTQRVYELMHHLEERGGSGGADREEERIRALCVAHERCTRRRGEEPRPKNGSGTPGSSTPGEVAAVLLHAATSSKTAKG